VDSLKRKSKRGKFTVLGKKRVREKILSEDNLEAKEIC
jgi:hypothetical protein